VLRYAHLLDHGHLDVSGIHVDRHIAALDCAQDADECPACITGALATRPEALANRSVLVQSCGGSKGSACGVLGFGVQGLIPSACTAAKGMKINRGRELVCKAAGVRGREEGRGCGEGREARTRHGLR
jgi:hypothetical protein